MLRSCNRIHIGRVLFLFGHLGLLNQKKKNCYECMKKKREWLQWPSENSVLWAWGQQTQDCQGATSALAQWAARQEVLNRQERALGCLIKKKKKKPSLFGPAFKNKWFRTAEGKAVLDPFVIKANWKDWCCSCRTVGRVVTWWSLGPT